MEQNDDANLQGTVNGYDFVDQPIRSIAIGDKMEWKFVVGRPSVDLICQDKEALYFNGCRRYIIYSRNNELKKLVVWKVIENMPVMVEYNMPSDDTKKGK